jgi:hypothetical protein
MASSLVNSWLKYVNWILFCSTKAKQASKQSYESEFFSSLINTNKDVIAHHCCLQDLVEGVNQRMSFSCH